MASALPRRSPAPAEDWCTHVVIVGSGIAGLACALALAPTPVILITKTASPFSGSSIWAQGGIAAAIGPSDTAEQHARDTVEAGAGLTDPDRAFVLARDGAAAVLDLAQTGVPFDRTADGSLCLGREAAHGHARIVHAGGDASGRTLIAALLDQVSRTPSIRVLPDCFAFDLIGQRNRARTLLAYQRERGWLQIHAQAVVLASGGIGALWHETTTPPETTGDGLAIAARAGALLADLEFMQFHPTAMAPAEGAADGRLVLLTEALRGAGAILLDRTGRRFMPSEHEQAELAPRDVVARAIARRTTAGEPVFLDLRPALASAAAHFPQAIQQTRRAGYDPFAEPVRIKPAAHYHMGGVVTDDRGRTSVDGLWACGEAACTFVHGANRLASNSLLEGLVFGRRVAQDILSGTRTGGSAAEPRNLVLPPPALYADALVAIRDELNRTMSRHVGIVRDGEGLGRACEVARRLTARFLEGAPGDHRPVDTAPDWPSLRLWGEVRNLLLTARLVIGQALARTESRGAHYRADYPAPSPAWARHQTLTLDDWTGDGVSQPAGNRDPQPRSAAS
jgi:L-aspartate oxidase